MFRWRGVLTARGALALSAATLGAILAVPGVGQATQSKRITASDPDYPPPYDSSKADRALQAFDKNHPECALWSDWRKLCSRIGPDGATYCRIDPEHPASPSAPFCARENGRAFILGKDDLPHYETARQSRSRFRFSKLGNNGYRIWTSSRPFSKISFPNIKNNACYKYSYYNNISRKLSSCQNDPVMRSGYCIFDLRNRSHYNNASVSCERWKPGWGGLYKPIEVDVRPSASDVIVLPAYGPDAFPFHEQ